MAAHRVPSPTLIGQAWLLESALHPAAVQDAWEAEELGEVSSGRHWRVAEARLRQSMEAIQRIPAGRLGPVLADVHRELAWWLLPAARANELDDVHRILIYPAGWILRCPPVTHSVDGRWWLERPDGTGLLTDPVLLGAAFGPGGPPLPGAA